MLASSALMFFLARRESPLFLIVAMAVAFTLSLLSFIWSLLILNRQFIRFRIKRAIKSVKKDGKLPYGSDVLINFGEELIFEIADGNELKIKYKNLGKVAVGSRAIYIYHNITQAFTVPFSAFETESQRDEFLEFINYKIDTLKEGK